jgi:hypothetical protein
MLIFIYMQLHWQRLNNVCRQNYKYVSALWYHAPCKCDVRHRKTSDLGHKSTTSKPNEDGHEDCCQYTRGHKVSARQLWRSQENHQEQTCVSNHVQEPVSEGRRKNKMKIFFSCRLRGREGGSEVKTVVPQHIRVVWLLASRYEKRVHSKWNAEQVISVTKENVFDPGSDFTGGSQTVRGLLPTTDLYPLKYSPVLWQRVNSTLRDEIIGYCVYVQPCKNLTLGML